MANLLKPTDTLAQGYPKINAAILQAEQASITSDQALANSQSTQEQLNQVIVEGDSSVEAAQARVNADNSITYDTLKERLDAEHQDINSQLADTENEIETVKSDLSTNYAKKDEVNLLVSSKAEKTYVDGQLITKRDKTTPLMMADLHTEVKTAMTGGSVAVVGLNAVGTENIKPNAVTSTKRTNLGEFGIITTSGVPNFDFTLKTFTIPTPARLVYRNEIYTLGDGVADVIVNIDITGYLLGSIFYNITTNTFKTLHTNNLNTVSENDILIATFYSNTKTVNMIGRYRVDGLGRNSDGDVSLNLNTVNAKTVDRVYLRHGNFHYRAIVSGTDVRLITTATHLYWVFKDNSYNNLDSTGLTSEWRDFTLSHNQCFVLNIQYKTLRITTFGNPNRLDPSSDIVLFSNISGNLSGALAYNVFAHQHLYGDNKVIVEVGKELLYKLNVPTSGGHFQSFAFVGDELWVFRQSADDHSTYSNARVYSVDLEQGSATQIRQFNHNWGHCNAINYNKHLDCFILGNGAGNSFEGTEAFYVFENVSNFRELSSININEYAIKYNVSSLGWGKQLNLTWGDSNYGKNNIAYAISNDGSSKRYIRKLLLGQGSNQLEHGSFISGKGQTGFNGTFKVLNTYERSYVYEEYNNGLSFYNGKIYEGLGSHFISYAEHELLDNGNVKTKIVKETLYADDGTKLSWSTTPSIEVEGLIIKDDKIFIGNVTNEIFVYKL